MDNPHKPPAGSIVGYVLAALVGTAFVVICAFYSWRYFSSRKRRRSETRRSYSLPIRLHGVNTSLDYSDAELHHHSNPFTLNFASFLFWGHRMESSHSSSENRIVRFTYKQLQKATNDFTKIIGKGAFGAVYKAMLPDTSVVAVKVLLTHSKQGEKEFQNEVMLLGRLHHRNLLNLVGYCAEGSHRLLVYDFMSNGSLNLRLHDEHYQALSWSQRVSIAQDVAKGIEYLHNGAVPPVIHRDIKSSNVLLDSLMVARVADFGLSKEENPDTPVSGIKGTYGYVDPEYISTNSLTYKSDVYSFGVLLFELIASRRPIEGLMDYVESVLASDGGQDSWLQILDPRLKGDCNPKDLAAMALIATKCIDNEAKKRPKMQEVACALSRLGPPKSESRKLNFSDFPSTRRVDRLKSAVKAVSRASSFQETC